MIDYCIKMPERDEYEKGHKFPYNSCEILCSVNGLNLDKLLNITNKNDEINNNQPDEGKNDENENNNGNLKKENIKEKNSEKKETVKENDIQKEDNDEVEIEKLEEIKVDLEDLEYEKEEKKEKNFTLVYSILDHFFSFLQDESSLNNDVLIGYFNKITNYLIKTGTKLVLNYILDCRENIITKLISHINKYSLSNILSNILNALSEEDNQESNDKYMAILNKLIEQFSLNENDSDTIEIICELIINSIVYNNRVKLSKVIESNIIDKFKNITQAYFGNYSQNKNKILHLINLLTKINKSILSNFTNKITSTTNPDDVKINMMNLINNVDKINNQFTSSNNIQFAPKEIVYNIFINNCSNYCNSMKDICLLIINDLIHQKQEQDQQNTFEEIGCSYSEKKIEKLGINKIIEFEFIISVFDIFINCLSISEIPADKTFINDYFKILLDTGIFQLMIEYYFKYKNNNFFTNIMIDLIKIIFDNSIAPEELIINILQFNNENNSNKDNTFISLLINDLIKQTKYIFEPSNNTVNSFILGSNITILKYIFTCKNSCMNNILEKLPNEQFFYDNLVINIDNIFSKKLFKTEEEIDKPVYDSLGVRIGLTKSIKGNSDIVFSLESMNDIINFYLKVYDKFLNGEEYMSLFKEREKKLEEIKKSNEYIRLGNQNKDDSETEEEEEENEYDDIDIPKPVFFNSKLQEKNKEEEKINEKKEDENQNNENNDENQKYNDINYWHTEVKDENMEYIIKELL